MNCMASQHRPPASYGAFVLFLLATATCTSAEDGRDSTARPTTTPLAVSQMADTGRARPTPASPWGRSAIQGLSPEQVRAYAQTLTFDTTHGVWDGQRLMVIDGDERRFGALAHIYPEIGSATLDSSQLAEGRFIAEVVVVSPDPVTRRNEYLNLGVRERVSYLWVGMAPDTSGEQTMQAFMVGATRPENRVRLQLEMMAHPRRFPEVAIGRWVMIGGEVNGGWTSCTVTRCCRVGGGGGPLPGSLR